MASRYFTQLQTMGINRVRVGGSFKTGAAGAGDTIVSKTGQGWTVSNTSPGIFLITFNDLYSAVEEAVISVGVEAETAVAVSPQFLVYKKPTPAPGVYYGDISLFTGNPLAIGTVAECIVNFHVVFVNTGVTPQ